MGEGRGKAKGEGAMPPTQTWLMRHTRMIKGSERHILVASFQEADNRPGWTHKAGEMLSTSVGALDLGYKCSVQSTCIQKENQVDKDSGPPRRWELGTKGKDPEARRNRAMPTN